MRFATEICWVAGMSEETLDSWFADMSESTRTARLHGWRLWHEYCIERDTTPQAMARVRNPVLVISDFVVYMDRQRTPEKKIREAVVAAKEIFGFFRPELVPAMAADNVLRTLVASAAAKVNRAPRYAAIWPLQQLLRFIANGPLNEALSRRDLMARAAAVFMILIPARPVGMFRMNPFRSRKDATGNNIIVSTKEKTDRGRGRTEFILRSMENKNLCPQTLFDLLRRIAWKKGQFSTLWLNDAGKPYKQPAFISLLLKKLLTAAGIPSRYAAYSIRHALITYLFESGVPELQVNAYTGHSQRAHTAATSYYHLDSQWIGKALADDTLRTTMSEKARACVAADALQRFSEEDQEAREE